MSLASSARESMPWIKISISEFEGIDGSGSGCRIQRGPTGAEGDPFVNADNGGPFVGVDDAGLLIPGMLPGGKDPAAFSDGEMFSFVPFFVCVEVVLATP